MRKKETDSFSMGSINSRASEQKPRKPSRFSLQRLFYGARPPSLSTPARSTRSVRSQTEIEARSVTSLHSSHGDREPGSSNSSDETLPHLPKKDSTRERHHKGDGLECPLCLSPQPRENFPLIMTCHHRSCRDCLRKYLKIEITESRINIACPECAERFHPNDIEAILDDTSLMLKYEEFTLRRVLVSDPDTRWCPAPDCGYAVIATGCASCPRLKCERPGCNTHFCYHCKQHWHPNKTCDAARAERSMNSRASISCSNDSSAQGDIKPCPRCSAFIVKMEDGSCNHMTCAVCGSEFCWLCMKEISDLHYLSPSGCTFWGKKPWSRKKKILWQLGTLVGAPVGITLIAGIAVPAIIIGVPVYVGKKLHTKYQYLTKHHRNAIVTSGVTASILLSPFLATVAVSIGVPILLAYVYGVVPISLCRSGGCGVTTNSGGVHFDFDDDSSGPAPSQPFPGPHQEEPAPHVTNPSIGPSIGEMSLAMTNSLSASGSHLDRVLREDSCDRDSASNRALAGASLSGSLCGATAAPYQHRLEVQADVATAGHKRSSLSSESANFSMDAKSATVSFGDDASTKALAGSISARDSVTVQVDVVNPSCASSTSNIEPTLPSKDSPTSSRSVNFIDEVGQQRTKRYKRQSLSLGDSIHEEQRLERAQVVCTYKEGSSIDSSDGLAVGGACSISMDSMRHGAIAQVESDRPFARSCSSASSESGSVRRHCCLHGEACSAEGPP